MSNLIRIFAAGALAVAIGCGGTSRNASPLVENIDEVTAATETGDFLALVAEGDAHWELRADHDETLAAIEAWESAIRVDTGEDDRNELLYPVYASLARAHYWLADGHLRWTDATDEEIADVHALGMEYGAQAIALSNEDWTRALLYETPVPEAVSVLTAQDIPAVYWYATNAGRWALAVSIAEVLARKDDIEAMMTRILELDAGYIYGAPHRYFGIYYTKIPFGNPALDQSLEHFTMAMEQYPEYLDNYFLYAEEYCRVMGDRDAAVEALEYIVAFDPSVAPDVLPENMNSIRKAEEMLANLDEYFNE